MSAESDARATVSNTDLEHFRRGLFQLRLTRGENSVEVTIDHELLADPDGLGQYINGPLYRMLQAHEAGALG